MRERRLKAHQRREREEAHWVGDGVALQDSLLADIGPIAYALDGLFTHHASQIAHDHQRDDERPVAVVLSPAETVPWQAGHLSKRFTTCIVTPNDDPIIEQASLRFNMSVFVGETPDALESKADCILFTDDQWPSQSVFEKALATAHRLMAENGRALFFLRTEIEGQETRAHWLSGGTTPLEGISKFELFDSWSYENVRLSEVVATRDFGVNDFAKRHKDFFGKYARDLCLARLYEKDFQDVARTTAVATLVIAKGFVRG